MNKYIINSRFGCCPLQNSEWLGELIIELGFIIEPGSTTKRSAVVRGASMSNTASVTMSASGVVIHSAANNVSNNIVIRARECMSKAM
jgi:hypothetical protein